MKVGKKLGALLLVLLMLAGMMTAVSAKVYTDLYDGLGSFDTESDYQSFAKDYVNLTAYRAMKTHSYYNDNGNGCMRVTRDASATEQGRFHLNTSFQPGKTYAIGFKAKDLDETETKVWVYSEAAKPRIEHGGTTTITGNLDKKFIINNTTWTEYSYVFTYTGTETKTGTLFLGHNAGTGYDYLIDDVQIIEVSDASVENKSQDLINAPLNSKAHYDLFRANEVSSLQAQAVVSYDSTEKAMKAVHNGDGQGRINLKGITLEKGANYNISFKAKAAVAGGTPKIGYYIVVGQPGVINRYQDGVYQAYDTSCSATLNSSEWTNITTNFTFLGDEKIGDKAENCLNFLYWTSQPDTDMDDYYVKDFVVTKYTPDYPELKVTVDEKISYGLNEVIAHTVYGVKGGEETPITSGVTYKSSNEGVVEVNEDGTIRAVGDGTATITALYDRVPVQFDVTVSLDATLDLSRTEKTVLGLDATSNTSQLIVDYVSGNTVETLVDENGNEKTDILFGTSDTSVATVTNTGLVIGKKSGTAVITAQYGELKKTMLIIVGETLSSNGFENDSNYTGTDQTVAKFDSKTRTGKGRSLWVNGYSGNSAQLGIFSFPQNYKTVQWWYYDDGATDNKVDGKGFFHVMTGSSPRLNLWIRSANNGRVSPHNAESDAYILDSGYPKYPVRSKGWHQFVLKNDNGKVTLYHDGIVVLQGAMIDAAKNKAGSVNYQRWAASQDGASIWMDEFVHVDTTAVAKHNVTVSVGENGTVKHGDTVVTSNSPVVVKEGDSVTLTITPNAGYQAKVTVDGQEVAVQDDNTVTISNITANKTVAVTFEKVITTPEISGNSADYIVSQDDYKHNNENHFAYVAYYKTVIPANYKVKKMGMNFGDDTTTIPLEVSQWTADYMFGVRVFGDAVKKENTYVFQGFAVVEDEDGQEVTITTGEPISK